MSRPPPLPSRVPPRSPNVPRATPPTSASPSKRDAPPLPAPRTNAPVTSRWPPANIKPDPPASASPKRPSPKPMDFDKPVVTSPKETTPKYPPAPKEATPKYTPPAPKETTSKYTPPAPRETTPRYTPPSPKETTPKYTPPAPKETTPTPKETTPKYTRTESPTAVPVVPAPSANGIIKHASFGSSLHNASEAITKRHEDELVALESLRFHIFNRAKQDKAYAEELARTNMRASKKAGNVSNPTSPIFQAWLCFLEMSENLQRQISNGAAQMSGVLLQTVDQLIRDKRGAKTVFDRERTKIDNEKKASCTLVQDLRRNYRHCSQKTESYKKKLEASLAKDPPKPAEQDRNRKKFVGSADKLHACHNDYCLSILNANKHLDHYRESLTPFSLDTLQQRMQLQIGQWRDAMLNYSKAVDFSQTYEESFTKLYESLEAVDQNTEYSIFVEDHKEELPELEYPVFDAGVLRSPVAPKVEEGKVVINNLTHNAMKTRLASLEDELEHHTKDIELQQEEVQELLSSTTENSDSFSSPTPASPAKESGQQPPKHVRIATLQATIKDLGCKQARKQEQAGLIKEAVEAMSGDSPPLFDPLGEGVDVSDLDASTASAAAGDTATMSKASRMMSIGTLKHMKNAGKKLKSMWKDAKRNRGGSTSTSIEENPMTKAMPSSVSHDTISSIEKDDDDMSDISSGDEYDLPPELPVEEEDWYFGDIDRRLAESKVKTDGDYLVRYSERQAKFVLTCKFKGASKHFVIQTFEDQSGNKMFRFESKAFSRIIQLLQYHVDTNTPVTRASGAKISKHISKHDKWSLQHSDLKMGRKIGKGAFGDVYEANLLKQDQKVAVKTCRSVDVYDMEKFLQEADILKGYQHPNIVSLIGVCAQKDPVYIVMEFMPGGSFLDFLRKKGGQQTKKKICNMVIDACKGMVYLEEQHCIHRDLAARNCLVGDEDIVKISDFGMSRESEDSEYTVQSGTRAIPIKWTAPEALNYGKYTPASDIWSYGIMLWEAFSCGSPPYPGMNNQDARLEIEGGYRMPPPADCPQEVYGVMLQCWQYDPEERPDFQTVLSMLEQGSEKITN